MRGLSRLLSWGSRLRRVMRGHDAGIEPSHPDFQAFALDRYAPHQQREIVKMIARQAVISRGDIADALERAERKSRLGGQLTGVATGVGFVAMFVLGVLVARNGPPPRGVEPASTASATPYPSHATGHWSPGGLDEADRQFFAELQAGPITTATAPRRQRPQPLPVAPPPVTPAEPPAMVATAQPAAPPATQPMPSRRETVIQLGAFADAADARARWKTMSGQFAALRPLTQMVSPIARGGRTLYRLQASGVDAADACPILTEAGATCVILDAATPADPQPAMATAAQPAVPHAAPPARHETVIQLGAFADAAIAKARWQALSARFPSLRSLTQMLSIVARDGRTLYRLRASGVDAADACLTLAGAGATCFVATDDS